jgi:uncharacterized protein (TIGR02271 family)
MVQINIPGTRNHLVAFFSNQEDALSAISELKDAGFNSDQIGLAMSRRYSSGEPASDEPSAAGGSAVRDTSAPESQSGVPAASRSTWDKIKDFFRGEEETYAGEDYSEAFGHLSMTGESARYYSSGLSRGGAVVTVRVPEDRLEEAREILTSNSGDLRTSGFEQIGTGTQQGIAGTEPGEKRIQLRGELLRAVKERVQRGEVRLRKEVVTEHQTINVPVSREEVIVEQVPPSEASPASGRIGDQGEVRIPVSEERVNVSKEPVVTGEVRVQKRTTQDTQQVSDEVRHEEVKVENEAGANVTDKRKVVKKKPAA